MRISAADLIAREFAANTKRRGHSQAVKEVTRPAERNEEDGVETHFVVLIMLAAGHPEHRSVTDAVPLRFRYRRLAVGKTLRAASPQ